jgi:hypothetical protein
MNIGMRLGLCSLLAALGTAAACSTSDTAGDRDCVSGEVADCTCPDGAQGTQVCNATGSGFSICDCSGGTGGDGGGTTGGSGGSATGGAAGSATGGTAGGGTGGGGMGGTGGDDAGVGGSGGALGDAGGPVCDTGALDGSTDTACNQCAYENCCAELWACADDPCMNPADDGGTFNEADLMLLCLFTAAGDGGTVEGLTQADVTACAADSGLAGGAVTPATLALMQCIVGQADAGANCKTECVYWD